MLLDREMVIFFTKSNWNWIFQIMDQELLILMPDQSLTFSSSDHFKYKILKYVVQNTPKIIILDGRFVRTIDATVAKVSYIQ